jgi:hypothetical protein
MASSNVYATACRVRCDELIQSINNSYRQLLQAAEVNTGGLDAAMDEVLAVDIAIENIVMAGDALLALSQELEQKAVLQEEQEMNAEVTASRIRYKGAQAQVDEVVLRVSREIKSLTEELMHEASK